MYRFALRPRWLVSHVLVVALVITMISLGLWQLRRLDERRDRNDVIEARSEEPVAPLPAVVGPDADPAEVDGVRYRVVEASGSFEPGSDVLVRNRTFDEQPGSWLLATLRLDDGDAVVVNRGWVPVTGVDEPTPDLLAPTGPVVVTGAVETTQERGRFGSTDPAEGTLRRVARVDVDRLADQIDGTAYPVWIQTRSTEPDPGELPVPVEPPELTDGPHLGYAVQWFIFSAIAVVGYPIVLRRVARQEDEPAVDDRAPAWDEGAPVGG